MQYLFQGLVLVMCIYMSERDYYKLFFLVYLNVSVLGRSFNIPEFGRQERKTQSFREICGTLQRPF